MSSKYIVRRLLEFRVLMFIHIDVTSSRYFFVVVVSVSDSCTGDFYHGDIQDNLRV